MGDLVEIYPPEKQLRYAVYSVRNVTPDGLLFNRSFIVLKNGYGVIVRFTRLHEYSGAYDKRTTIPLESNPEGKMYFIVMMLNYVLVDHGEDEEIKILPSPYEEEAKKQYETALRAVGSSLRHRTENDDELFFFGGDTKKWHLDVAIDCVREMDENDRTYVANHLQTTDYHFGYAMGIRNEYIYPAKKHHSFMADNDSTEIMKVIFSILHRGYSFRNPVCTKYFESFEYGCLVHKYGESAKDLFVAIENRIFSQEENLTAEDALNQLKESLTKKYGKISIY